MNADATRDIKQILAQGWYRQGQSIPEDGWAYLLSQTLRWKRYVLILPNGSSEVVAESDQSAVAAFHSLFSLEDFPYEIVEKIVDYRVVEDNIHDPEDIESEKAE